jgi:hypothetical protein
MSYNKYALLIGINYFGSDCELQGCHSDIEDVKVYLKSIGYIESNVTVLTDDKLDIDEVFPTRPTKENIIANMRYCVAKCKKGDTLYIHYSGHGSNRIDRSGDEKDGIDECICPVDCDTAGMIYDDDLRILLVNNLIDGANLRVVFDACHSGSAIDLPFRWDGDNNIFRENTDVRVNKNVIFLSGCKDPQYSADSSFEGHPNGALTWAYLKALNSIKKSNMSGNQKKGLQKVAVYTWKDLGDMIRLTLKKEGYDQVPQISMMKVDQLKAKVDLL